MNKELITRTNSELCYVVSASASIDADTVYLEIEDENGNKLKIALDLVSANGLRIAIGSLQNISRLVLPKNPMGDYQCHFLSIKYRKDGEIVFDKDNGETAPLGKYIDIDDGLISFNKDDVLWISVALKDANVCEIEEKEFLTVIFPEKKTLEELKEKLDKEIFPFDRFGKTNKLSYGYFHSIKEE